MLDPQKFIAMFLDVTPASTRISDLFVQVLHLAFERACVSMDPTDRSKILRQALKESLTVPVRDLSGEEIRTLYKIYKTLDPSAPEFEEAYPDVGCSQ